MSSPDRRLHRSYLYAPGSDPRVMRKALAAGADAVVFDLEDAVAPAAKNQARREVSALLAEVVATDRGPAAHVRINRQNEGYDAQDVRAVVCPGLAAVRLPKAESGDAVREVDELITELEIERSIEPGSIGLYPTIESARGAVAIAEVATASSRTVRIALGASDLLADIGAIGDDDLATLYVRSELVLRSRVAELGPPVDSVHTDLADGEALKAEAQRARALGFFGKSVIHPRQLNVVHQVFTPSDAELSRAEEIVRAAEQAEGDGRGAVAEGGAFIDAAVLARARGLLAIRRDL